MCFPTQGVPREPRVQGGSDPCVAAGSDSVVCGWLPGPKALFLTPACDSLSRVKDWCWFMNLHWTFVSSPMRKVQRSCMHPAYTFIPSSIQVPSQPSPFLCWEKYSIPGGSGTVLFQEPLCKYNAFLYVPISILSNFCMSLFGSISHLNSLRALWK